MTARLDELVKAGLALRVIGDGATAVTGVRHDSRTVEPGDLFVAMGGRVFDGADYSRQAIERGAIAVASDRPLDLPVPVLLIEHPERALSALAVHIYGNATANMPVVGITGTNGKTTVAYLVEQMLNALGQRPAVIGTVSVRGPGGIRPATHTTPMADEVTRLAHWARDTGASELIMEVSSHALAMARVEDVRFQVAAFTNLSQDHLDFHGDLTAYAAAKDRLFIELAPGRAVINLDDDHGMELARTCNAPLLRYSAAGHAQADIRVVQAEFSRSGTVADLVTPAGHATLKSPLLGQHNLENLLCTLGVGLSLGHSLPRLVEALATATGAPGRLQRVAHPSDVLVFVDYAHTPDALDNVCAALKPLTTGRLIVVFGCGGDRDRGKRPLMGEATARYAHLAVVTSDNPRSERPSAIVDDILPGLSALGPDPLTHAQARAGARGYVVEVDREAAINLALAAAAPRDTVLIAGKGHEQYQIVGQHKLPFDDVAVAQRAILEGQVA